MTKNEIQDMDDRMIKKGRSFVFVTDERFWSALFLSTSCEYEALVIAWTEKGRSVSGQD